MKEILISIKSHTKVYWVDIYLKEELNFVCVSFNYVVDHYLCAKNSFFRSEKYFLIKKEGKV